jgi:ribosomal protein L14E/L6E/L27E
MADIEIGQVVYSKRGRDKGLPFVIMKIDGEYLYLCDGSCRVLLSPKRKKLKHVQLTNYVCVEIAAAVCESKPLLDANIRNAVKGFVLRTKV